MLDKTNGAVPLEFASESRHQQWAARAVTLDFIANELIERRNNNPQAFMRRIRSSGLRIDTSALYQLRRDAWDKIEGALPPGSSADAKKYRSPRGYLTPCEESFLSRAVESGRAGKFRAYFQSIQKKGAGYLLDAFARLHQEPRGADLDKMIDPPQGDPEKSAAEELSSRSRIERLREAGKLAAPDPYAYVEIRIDSRCGSDTVAAVIAMALDLGGVQDLDLRAALSQDKGGNIHLKLNP